MPHAHLVIAPLYEAGVDGRKWDEALACQPRAECDRVLLRNAHVEDTTREAPFKA